MPPFTDWRLKEYERRQQISGQEKSKEYSLSDSVMYTEVACDRTGRSQMRRLFPISDNVY